MLTKKDYPPMYNPKAAPNPKPPKGGPKRPIKKVTRHGQKRGQ